MELNQHTIEEIYKDIRSSKKYMKHAKKQYDYLKNKMYAHAAMEGKIMRDMEVAVWNEVAKRYVDKNQITIDIIASMSDEDKKKMNIMANGLMMIADVLDNMVSDTNQILSKYDLSKSDEFDCLKQLLAESKKFVSYFDNRLNDEKASFLFGQMSDNLYKMTINKAGSYVRKLKEYAEELNKKAASVSEVA